MKEITKDQRLVFHFDFLYQVPKNSGSGSNQNTASLTILLKEIQTRFFLAVSLLCQFKCKTNKQNLKKKQWQ